jgi:Trk-type K+ transport system membrane component
MHHFWWLFHIIGICFWLGGTATVALAWSRAQKAATTANRANSLSTRLGADGGLPLLIRLANQSGHIGAGLTAITGTVLSFLVEPKIKLAYVWLTYMQGMGVVVFVFSVFVLTRRGKQLLRHLNTETASVEETVRLATIYHRWLWTIVLLLLSILVFAAFKPH